MQAIGAVIAALLAVAAPGVQAQGTPAGAGDVGTKADREDLAAHAIGLNFFFMEAQRAGTQAADSATLFPSLWEWKKPAYTNVCTEVLAELPPADAAKVNLKDYAGYFEAGNAVTVTGIMGFVALQRALGALAFMPQLEANMPRASRLGDPNDCLTGGYTSSTLKQLYMREMRYLANVMENSILVSKADGSDFKILIGVADTQTFGDFAPPSWDTPPSYQEICYVGDMDNPAADIAASVAAALAVSAKVAREYGGAQDKADADRWEMLAERAFDYAKNMTHEHADEATCTVSSAGTNCVGSGCSATGFEEGTNNPTCTLYENLKPPRQHLWVAAAALYYSTGTAYYRAEADYFWDRTFATFLFNWNNVPAQGLIIMNLAPDFPGAKYNKTYYQTELAEGAGFWTTCSEEGQVDYQGYVFCRKTPDGSAYPLDFPWGNLGSITNGMCLSAMYQHLNFDDASSPARVGNRCFMQEQIGYLFNHKCTTEGSACNTNGTEGFSYMVGMGPNYPTRLHSRDAAYPNFDLTVLGEPDGNLMCGAMAPGPYAGGGNEVQDGPVLNGTDAYLDDRRRWRESEPALDTTGGIICALMGYAALPEGSFDSCPATRTAFTGYA